MGSLPAPFLPIRSRPHRRRFRPSLKERQRERQSSFSPILPRLPSMKYQLYPPLQPLPAGYNGGAVCSWQLPIDLLNVQTQPTVSVHAAEDTPIAYSRVTKRALKQSGQPVGTSWTEESFLFLVYLPDKAPRRVCFSAYLCAGAKEHVRPRLHLYAPAWHSAVTTWPSACLSSPSLPHPAPIVRGERLSEWKT